MRAGWSIGRGKERYFKYENSEDELVGQILTSIPTTSCEIGIAPVYFSNSETNETQVADFACLVFPIEYSKLISLRHVLLATFIYNERWTLESTPPTCPLRTSLYFSFTDRYPERLSFVKTSLPWENDCDCPVLTGIPIHC